MGENNKPDDIDQWAWDVAMEIVYGFDYAKQISKALMQAKAEQREADAKIAEDGDGCYYIGRAIRDRGE